MDLEYRIGAAMERALMWCPSGLLVGATAVVESLAEAGPAELAPAIHGSVEEGTTATTQGMVRLVGPWVPKGGA